MSHIAKRYAALSLVGGFLFSPAAFAVSPISVVGPAAFGVYEGQQGNITFKITATAADAQADALSLSASMTAQGPDFHDTISIGNLNNNTCGFSTGFFGIDYGRIGNGCTVSIDFNSDPYDFDLFENHDFGVNLITVTAMTSLGAGGETGLGSGSLAITVVDLPEPATWALMIAGFGVVGSAIRRRSRRVSTSLRYTSGFIDSAGAAPAAFACPGARRQ